MAGSIASEWTQLSGESNWKDLLHPLNIDLRRYLIQYGERPGAAGALYNNNKASRGYGHSLYPPDEFFSRAGLEIGNPFKYSVTDFFYAVSETGESDWIGYVAVATDEGKAVLGRRDILVAWRGTVLSELENIIDFPLVPASELFGNENDPKVFKGFLALYTVTSPTSVYSKTSAREQVLKAIRKLVDKYEKEDTISITVTGHSLGAAMATINAMDIVANGYNKPTDNSNKSCMVTAFTYGGPRVGNNGLKEVFEKLSDLRLLRITNQDDIITKLPYVPGFYTHFGDYLEISTTKSEFLKKTNVHMLEVYLHGLAGAQENGEFKLEFDYDIALLNKALDALKDEYKIPSKWWTNENFKTMVQMDNGHWKLVDNAYVPDPPAA